MEKVRSDNRKKYLGLLMFIFFGVFIFLFFINYVFLNLPFHSRDIYIQLIIVFFVWGLFVFLDLKNEKTRGIYFSDREIIFLAPNSEKISIKWEDVNVEPGKIFFSGIYSRSIEITSKHEVKLRKFLTLDWATEKSVIHLVRKYVPIDHNLVLAVEKIALKRNL